MAQLGLGGPLAAFQIGQQMGKARSPVNGLGQAIRNVLDTARKGGLLQTQSLAQAQASNVTNVLKEERAAERETEQIPLVTVGPGGAVDTSRTIQRGAKVVTEPAQGGIMGDIGNLEEVMSVIRKLKGEGGTGIDKVFPQSEATDMTVPEGAMTASNASGQSIYSTDGGNTWRDRATGKLIQ